MHAASETGLVTLQFPWMWPIMNNLPDWLVLKMNPLLALLFKCQRVSGLNLPSSLRVP